MQELIGVLVPVLVFLLPLSLGLWGWRTEKKHLAQLEEDEKKYAGILVSDMKYLPSNWGAKEPVFVSGSVVIANDALKKFIAGWLQVFGGRINAYEKMVQRARREATIRMLKQAAQSGSNVVWNVRITTSTIGIAENSKQAAGVEALAYGTAMKVFQK